MDKKYNKSRGEIKLFPIHDFSAKLRQGEVLSRLKDYVNWQIGVRKQSTVSPSSLPNFAPVSINLDITTACNFACDHCVDKEILNTKERYQQGKLLDSLKVMSDRGLKSVIVIGGGEPTLYRYFVETIEFMKSLGLQVAVVSNGSRTDRIAEVAHCLDANDWVRLSLDSGSDEIFQAMHKPLIRITLDEICEGVPKIKTINPNFKVGFSFIITWQNARINDTNIVENLDEMVQAAQRAKDYGFDYVAFKPFLTRAEENNAEIVDLNETQKHLTIEFMKSLGLQVAVVSNGSRTDRIAEVAHCLDANDWVRLSLDSGSDEIFQAMHKPLIRITLDEICEGVPKIKTINPNFKVGFSFIITWQNARINDTNIVENLDEMVQAAQRAKDYGFDYVAFKPFLTRAEENNAEIVDLNETQKHFDQIKRRISVLLEEAKKLESDSFQVYATTNLKVLLKGISEKYMNQPHQCHMQYFRQVLSPLGLYNCPVYRNQPNGRLGNLDAYSSKDLFNITLADTGQKIKTFDSAHECREVTCLYNTVNWWIEDLIENPEKLESLAPPVDFVPDFFL